VERAVLALDDDLASETFTTYLNAWWSAFVPSSSGWTQGVGGSPPSRQALLALGQLASQLSSALVSSKRALSEALIDELLEDIKNLLNDPNGDSDNDPEINDLVLQRLNDVAWALRNYRILGSEGLEAALDRLTMALFRTGGPTPEPGSWRGRAFAMAGKAYTAIAVPGVAYSTYQALEAAEPVLRSLGK
jgi:hypothetical protein